MALPDPSCEPSTLAGFATFGSFSSPRSGRLSPCRGVRKAVLSRIQTLCRAGSTGFGFSQGQTMGKRSKRSGSHCRKSSGTSGEKGQSRSIPPPLKTSTVARRPWDATSRRKFMIGNWSRKSRLCGEWYMANALEKSNSNSSRSIGSPRILRWFCTGAVDSR